MLLCTPAGDAVAQELPPITEMTPQQATEAARADKERLAREQLQQAKLGFDRGEFDKAIELFKGILDSPVALRGADDLHDGFLHYAFTLVLMENKVPALEKLRTALELKPEFAPSPVTTRPDLLAFYQEQQALFIASGGIQKLPSELFPELAQGNAVVRVRRELPIPVFGVRLRQLGRPAVGNTLMGFEVGTALLNVAGWIAWGAVFEDLRPSGDRVRDVFRISNPVTFGLFWGTIAAELIVTAVMNQGARSARTGAIRPFEGQPGADSLRAQALDPSARRRAGPRLMLGPGGVVLTTW